MADRTYSLVGVPSAVAGELFALWKGCYPCFRMAEWYRAQEPGGTVLEQNNSNAESRQVRNYFIRGASRDANLNYPNREWGLIV